MESSIHGPARDAKGIGNILNSNLRGIGLGYRF
jgi:hypothetical protein